MDTSSADPARLFHFKGNVFVLGILTAILPQEVYMVTTVSPRMRIDEVTSYLRCSKTHLYALHKRRLLIRRTEGRRFSYWVRAEVEAFAIGFNPYEQAD